MCVFLDVFSFYVNGFPSTASPPLFENVQCALQLEILDFFKEKETHVPISIILKSLQGEVLGEGSLRNVFPVLFCFCCFSYYLHFLALP